ncbi:protein of unknown function [Lachnospiraceae bacterium XBB1006]|nr:protein of unknown function [Lachnospiraceae bacterium XBB1006]
MKIMVVDGQGGRIGSMFIEKWIKSGGSSQELVAVGTNSAATTAMLKAGAIAGATGENPVVVNAKDADVIVGPIGIIAADALLGEVTPKMAVAIAGARAKKLLIPMNNCDHIVMGIGEQKLTYLVDEMVERIQGM